LLSGRSQLALHRSLGRSPLAGERPAARVARGRTGCCAAARRAGEPVAYLVGQREFWGLALKVSPAVLIPRPETETLVEAALARMPDDRPLRVIDLGTGSGAIALAIAHERRNAHIWGTDVSEEALAVARDNAERLALRNVAFLHSDWYAAVPAGRFDAILSNPPYVAPGDAHLNEGDLRFEPRIALTPGDDALRALKTIITGAAARLVPGGSLIVEHGFDQSDVVLQLFAASGFADIRAFRDLSGTARVVAGRGVTP